jgi:hypothetical protein
MVMTLTLGLLRRTLSSKLKMTQHQLLLTVFKEFLYSLAKKQLYLAPALL